MADKKPIDFTALTRGLLQDLRDAASARPPRPPKRSEGSGLEQIEKVADRIRTDRDAGLEPIEATYRERAEAASALLTRREKRIEAYAKRERRVVAADPAKFIVAGRVVDASTGVGLPNVKVNVFDAEREHDERLDATCTDALGYYRREYTAPDLEKLGPRPRAFVEVLDGSGEAIFTSEKAFTQKLGATEFISAEVDGNKVPTSRDLGKRIDGSVSARIDGIRRRKRVSKPRGDLVLRKLRKQPKRDARTLRPLRSERREKPARPRRDGTPTSPERSVMDVKGIGSRFASTLAAAGITRADELAAAEPERLAQILEITVSRAASLVDEARRVSEWP